MTADDAARLASARAEAHQQWGEEPDLGDESYQSIWTTGSLAGHFAGAAWQREQRHDATQQEAVARALCEAQESIEHMEQTDDMPCSRCLAWADAALAALTPAQPDDAVALLRAEAAMAAKALREAADEAEQTDPVAHPFLGLDEMVAWLLSRAENIENGDDRG